MRARNGNIVSLNLTHVASILLMVVLAKPDPSTEQEEHLSDCTLYVYMHVFK